MKKTQVILSLFLTAFLMVLFLTLFLVTETTAQTATQPPASKKAKILFFSGASGGHSPAKIREDGTSLAGTALKQYFADKNVELVESQDGTLFDGDVSEYDAFVFYTTGNLQDQNRNVPEMRPMSDKGIMTLLESVRSGKGFVAIHGGSDTHCKVRVDGKDPYVAMVGGRFCGHGPSQFVTITAVEPVEVPWLKEVNGKFTAHEEWYAMREFNPDMRVVFAMPTKDLYPHPDNIKNYGRPEYPLCWIRMEGKGRVAYTPMGHDDRFWWNAWNVRTVGEFVEWSLGRFDMDTTPNIDEVCPGYAEMPK